jgi:hypothetical protein
LNKLLSYNKKIIFKNQILCFEKYLCSDKKQLDKWRSVNKRLLEKYHLHHNNMKEYFEIKKNKEDENNTSNIQINYNDKEEEEEDVSLKTEEVLKLTNFILNFDDIEEFKILLENLFGKVKDCLIKIKKNKKGKL